MSSTDQGPGGADRPQRPRLERAPGERYRGARSQAPATAPSDRPGPEAPAPRTFGVVLGVVLGVAAAGALVVFLLGQVDIGAGLLAIAATIGWLTGVALVWGDPPGLRSGRRRLAVAALLAAAAITAGFGLDWAWSRILGGALDPLAYLDQRYGLLAWLNLLVAALAGGLRAR